MHAQSDSIYVPGAETPPVARAIITTAMSPYCPGLTLEVCPSPQADSLRKVIIARVQRGDTRARLFGKRYRCTGSFPGKFGPVGGNQDVFVHGASSTVGGNKSVQPGSHPDAEQDTLCMKLDGSASSVWIALEDCQAGTRPSAGMTAPIDPGECCFLFRQRRAATGCLTPGAGWRLPRAG